MTKFYYAEGVPGTGKTTLGLKVYLRAKEEGYNVCYETFRKNMLHDFVSRLGYRDEWVGTTHGICYKLLRIYLRYDRDCIATPEVWKDFCRKHGIQVDPLELRKEITNINELMTPGAKIYAIYSNCINTLTDFDDWDTLPPRMKPYLEPRYSYMVTEIIDKWVSYLEKRNMLDFPMMLYKCYEYRLSPPTDVYIADEFQDKTKIQFELFKIWSKDKEIVLVLGDKAQSIYSFWSADPRFCDEVRKKSKFKVLSPSWRLSQHVYNVAKALLQMSGQETFDVECVGKTRLTELDFMRIFNLIMDYKGSIMIIARTGYHVYTISRWLIDFGIPFVGRFGWSEDMLRLYSFIWKFKKAVEPIYKSEITEYAKATNIYNPIVYRHLKGELSLKDVNAILPSYHKSVLSSDDPFGLINLDDKVLTILRKAYKVGSPPRGDILLTTIHGAKGLEADMVVVFDGITKKVNQTMIQDHDEYKNEFRVWYVALTRARDICVVVRVHPIRYSIPFLPKLAC